jgi:hypothetical protein
MLLFETPKILIIPDILYYVAREDKISDILQNGLYPKYDTFSRHLVQNKLIFYKNRHGANIHKLFHSKWAQWEILKINTLLIDKIHNFQLFESNLYDGMEQGIEFYSYNHVPSIAISED